MAMNEAREALMMGRNSAGKLIQRPLSPHLQVYKPQITSMLSIAHRITGVAISVGTLLMVWWFVAAASSDSAYAHASGFIRSPFGLLLLFGWTASLWYHFCNGIRHLAWDAGFGFELPMMRNTGMAVLAGTAALTLLTWIAIFAAL